MRLELSQQDESFRHEFRTWLDAQLEGPFRQIRGRGLPGDEHAYVEERRTFERVLGQAGWTGIGWPKEHGGRGASLLQQVIFHEEYSRADGPGRLGHIGERLLGPTLIAFGTEQQKARYLPPILRGDALWCQGYSEPGAGSDLASVQTRASLRDGRWVIDGQKIWTSGAQNADFCFVLCRTSPEAPRHAGLSYLLVPMRQTGIDVRPIVQMTGGSEFSEVFFDGAVTEADNVVGAVNDGWKIAIATLAFERGASTLGQQLRFQNELDAVIEAAKKNGKLRDGAIRQRIAQAFVGLRVMRFHALRSLGQGEQPTLARHALVNKLHWASWHRQLGELAMDVLGAEGELTAEDGKLLPLQRLFLSSRSDTIYAGTNQIQRNVIAERGLGLPREPRDHHK
jgi:alkylation response protein AidB-like acyl-CoA dehydrogenase